MRTGLVRFIPVSSVGKVEEKKGGGVQFFPRVLWCEAGDRALGAVYGAFGVDQAIAEERVSSRFSKVCRCGVKDLLNILTGETGVCVEDERYRRRVVLRQKFR